MARPQKRSSQLHPMLAFENLILNYEFPIARDVRQVYIDVPLNSLKLIYLFDLKESSHHVLLYF